MPLHNRFSSNPTGVELSTGGIYENAENVLIAGRIAVFTDFSRNAIQNYNEILKAMKECFIKKIMFMYLKRQCYY